MLSMASLVLSKDISAILLANGDFLDIMINCAHCYCWTSLDNEDQFLSAMHTADIMPR